MAFRLVPADLVLTGKFRGSYTLLGPYIQSPNYSPGASGWAIFGDGSAEFNNLTIRGTFKGNDFEINQYGSFYYSGPAGAGNLISSVAPLAGTDTYGNAYLPGTVSYVAGTPYAAVAVDGGYITYYTAASYTGPWTIIGTIDQGVPAGYTGLRWAIDAGTAQAEVDLISDGTSSWLLPRTGTILAAPDPATGLPDLWTDYTTGMPAGWTGRASFKLLPFSSVVWDFDITVAAGTSITHGETILTGISTEFYSTAWDAVKTLITMLAPSGTLIAEPFILDTAGNLKYSGPAATVPSGGYSFSGSGTYPLDR